MLESGKFLCCDLPPLAIEILTFGSSKSPHYQEGHLYPSLNY